MLNLKKLRGTQTTRQVSVSTGLTEATIRNAEEKPHLMSAKTIFALSDYYGVSMDEIVDKESLRQELSKAQTASKS